MGCAVTLVVTSADAMANAIAPNAGLDMVLLL
jgi:hypothetical protein